MSAEVSAPRSTPPLVSAPPHIPTLPTHSMGGAESSVIHQDDQQQWAGRMLADDDDVVHPSVHCYIFAGDNEGRVCIYDSTKGMPSSADGGGVNMTTPRTARGGSVLPAVVPADANTVESLLLGPLGGYHVQAPTMRQHRMVLRRSTAASTTTPRVTHGGPAALSTPRTTPHHRTATTDVSSSTQGVTSSRGGMGADSSNGSSSGGGSSNALGMRHRSHSFTSTSRNIVAAEDESSIATGVESLWSFTVPWRHYPEGGDTKAPSGGSGGAGKLRRVVVVLALVAPLPIDGAAQDGGAGEGERCNGAGGAADATVSWGGGPQMKAHHRLCLLEQHPTLIPSCLKRLVPVAFSCARRWFDGSWDRLARLAQIQEDAPTPRGGVQTPTLTTTSASTINAPSSSSGLRVWKMEHAATLLAPRVEECCTSRLRKFFAASQPLIPATAPATALLNSTAISSSTYAPSVSTLSAPTAAASSAPAPDTSTDKATPPPTSRFIDDILKKCFALDPTFTCAVVTAALGLLTRVYTGGEASSWGQQSRTCRMVILPSCQLGAGHKSLDVHKRAAKEHSETIALLASWFAFATLTQRTPPETAVPLCPLVSSPGLMSSSSSPTAVRWGDIESEHSVTIVDLLDCNPQDSTPSVSSFSSSCATTINPNNLRENASRSGTAANGASGSPPPSTKALLATAERKRRHLKRKLGMMVETSTTETVILIDLTSKTVERFDQQPSSTLNGHRHSQDRSHGGAQSAENYCFVSHGCIADTVPQASSLATIDDVLESIKQQEQCPVGFGLTHLIGGGLNSSSGGKGSGAGHSGGNGSGGCNQQSIRSTMPNSSTVVVKIVPSEWVMEVLQWILTQRTPPTLTGVDVTSPLVSLDTALAATRQHLQQQALGYYHALGRAIRHHRYFQAGAGHSSSGFVSPPTTMTSGGRGGGGGGAHRSFGEHRSGDGGALSDQTSGSVINSHDSQVPFVTPWESITNTFRVSWLVDQLQQKNENSGKGGAMSGSGRGGPRSSGGSSLTNGVGLPLFPSTSSLGSGSRRPMPSSTLSRSSGVQVSARGGFVGRASTAGQNLRHEAASSPFEPTKLRLALLGNSSSLVDGESNALCGGDGGGMNFSGADGGHLFNSFCSNASTASERPGGAHNANNAAAGYLLSYSPPTTVSGGRTGSFLPRRAPQFLGSTPSQISDDGSSSQRSFLSSTSPYHGGSPPPGLAPPDPSATPVEVGHAAAAVHTPLNSRKLNTEERQSLRKGLLEYTGNCHLLHVQLLQLLGV